MKRNRKIILGVMLWAVMMLGGVCTARADERILRLGKGVIAVSDVNGVCSSLKIKSSDIIFSSLVSSSDIVTEPPTGGATAGRTYKLTIKDQDAYGNMQMVIDSAGASWEGTSETGKIYSIPFSISGANAGNATQVSVVVTTSDITWSDAGWTSLEEPQQYAKLNVENFPASGTGTFTLNDDIDGISWGTDFHVYLVAEDVNAWNETDYASVPKEIGINNTIISVPITFKVVGGAWDDGLATDKVVILSRGDNEDKLLKLTDSDIPAVGSKPADGFKAGAWDVIPPTDRAISEPKTYTYTYEEKPRISATVNFKVVNGSWNDGTAAEKTVTLTGHEGDTLKLAENQIPAVGSKPNETFKAGSWDTVPTTSLSFTNGSNTTFTYAYVQKHPITATVTFKVANGSWDDGTTADKTVTLNGLEGDTLKLAESQIPAVGTKPGSGYQRGSWDVVPSPDTAITEDTTYTYRYVKESVTYSAVVTFRVLNGSWDDGTAADKQVTLSGAEGSILYLEAGQIPSAGSRPNSGFKAGSWDAVPNTQSPITRDESFTYTYAAEPAPAPEPTPAPSPNIEEPITVPKAPAYVRAKGKKAKVIVTWRKIKKTTKTKALRAMIQGIQVQAATDPDFKNIVKTVNIEKNKTKVKLKLPGQTSYYVRVRYVGADGVSAWSKVKKATAK